MEHDEILFQLFGANAKVPTRATDGSAGFDLYASQPYILRPGDQIEIETGVRCAIPEFWCGQIWPRSSMARKNRIDRRAGLIDSDYRGEIIVLLTNEGNKPREVKVGERIGQLVVVPFLHEARLVDDLDETTRGEGGFGHSGN